MAKLSFGELPGSPGFKVSQPPADGEDDFRVVITPQNTALITSARKETPPLSRLVVTVVPTDETDVAEFSLGDFWETAVAIVKGLGDLVGEGGGGGTTIDDINIKSKGNNNVIIVNC